jgi:Domain of Unknown Function with PDB structure (DUF3857)/Transglutaminase-like superfamily
VYRFRLFLYASFLLSLAAVQGVAQDWQPVVPQELQMKEFAAAPEAAAVQLYYRESTDHEHQSIFRYQRIKILNDKGKKYADVEIPVQPFQHLAELKARTIHPDGTIIDFTGQPFEKTVVRNRDFKFLARTFTMPEVTVGSIIEYKYRVTWDPTIAFYDTVWSLQHDLYTVKQQFDLRATTKYLYGWDGTTKHMNDTMGLSYSYSHMPSDLKPQKGPNSVKLDVDNMPAFEDEPSMPDEHNFKPEVRFFYGGRELHSADAFWRDYGFEWYGQAEHFISDADEIRKAAAAAIGNETDPEKKLRRLYARAQEVRNLSVERSRSTEESKKENLKPNENARDVLNHGYGKHNDIARLFASLARVSGFEAGIVRASSRKTRFFDSTLLSTTQLAWELVVVKLNGNDIYLDPGTSFCPFGLASWEHTATAAMRLDKNGGTFVNVPPVPAERSVLRRVARGSLNEDGDLEGEITMELNGSRALEHRLEALEMDQEGRNKTLESEMKAQLPRGAVVDLKESKGWEQAEGPLVAVFKFRVPAFGSPAGKRFLLPAFLFQNTHKDAFQLSARKYPLYFQYAYGEIDNVILKVPSGYTMETVPAGANIKLPSVVFASQRTFQGGEFISKRALLVNGILFEPAQYAELRGFFNKVQTTDDEQAVLQRSAVDAKN